MKRFCQLYRELDETTRTNRKVEALVRYFREAQPADAAWALYFLTGNKIKRSVSSALLREWAAEAAGFPLWLVDEAYHAVGDLAETLSLVLPEKEGGESQPLSRLITERLEPMAKLGIEEKKKNILSTWEMLGSWERFLWNKILTGNFRVGVSKTLVIRALSQVAEVEPAIMASRLMGKWSPTADAFTGLLNPSQENDPAKPYPFYLAYQIDQPLSELGHPEEWMAEWKWDGIRAQLIRRGENVSIWSRGEELVTDRFPELLGAAIALPTGVVLDGEILTWRDQCPLPFGLLQKRIGRLKAQGKILEEAPVVFMAYDLLEKDGLDYRSKPFSERRKALEDLLVFFNGAGSLLCSSTIPFGSWEELTALHDESRVRCVEGMMLKKKSSPYGVGRRKGDWWKWKVDPHHVDAVLIYAQPGHGRRASLYTDYTFAVWKNEELVPVAKAYSGLDASEIDRVDQFIRKNTTDRFGPVRVVKPELVFEIAFEGIEMSNRHKSGVAVRFPRIARWRHDKKPEEADTLDHLRQLLRSAS